MKLVVILDNVRSVHNVGSIFRTADAVGTERIFCCGITPSPLDRFGSVRADFAKVALGAEQSVAWEAGKTGKPLATVDVIQKLRSDAWKILAVEQAKNAVAYYEAVKTLKKDEKIALVIGAEVDGVSKEVLAMADEILEIPMRGKKESLNVAVAFGIVAYRIMI